MARVDFLRRGVDTVPHPEVLYRRLAQLYDLAGDSDRSDWCRRKADEQADPPAGEVPPVA